MISFLFLKEKSRSEIKVRLASPKKAWGHMLHEMLSMRKLSAQRLPSLLTPDNKYYSERTSQQSLVVFKRNPKEFLGEETGVHKVWSPMTTWKEQNGLWALLWWIIESTLFVYVELLGRKYGQNW